MGERILVVDDEETFRETLCLILGQEGHEVIGVSNGAEALGLMAKKPIDIVICDVKMPGIDGMEVLKKTNETRPQTSFIMVTAYGTVEMAVEAMKKGAYDYILKPLAFDEIIVKIKHIGEMKALKAENRSLQEQLRARFDFKNIVGNSDKMQHIMLLIEKVSGTTSNVLVTGESGTGKELVARAIHHTSKRKDKPFMVVNCGAIPDNLIESELFGHVKGAFTGAIRDNKGFFEAADGGTLFLDEISSMPLAAQAKLLRAIEDKQIQPVGTTRPIDVNLRIIVATNRNLRREVEKGNFRQDLYYRLNVVEIPLPPLRERPEDIPSLVEYFIPRYNVELHKNCKGVDPAAMRLLMACEWKGNVRELENVIERAMILSEDEQISVSDLPPSLQYEASPALVQGSLKGAKDRFEKDYIKTMLEAFGNNKARAAEVLGVSLSTLYRKIQEPSPLQGKGPLEEEVYDSSSFKSLP